MHYYIKLKNGDAWAFPVVSYSDPDGAKLAEVVQDASRKAEGNGDDGVCVGFTDAPIHGMKISGFNLNRIGSIKGATSLDNLLSQILVPSRRNEANTA